MAIVGHSMEPTLRDGDWLLVDPRGYAAGEAAAGDLVVTLDPRSPGRRLVKRVARINADGSLALAGDHPAHAGEPGLDGVSRAAVLGRAWFRYWPLSRIGRVR